jgi:hypothetical protein
VNFPKDFWISQRAELKATLAVAFLFPGLGANLAPATSSAAPGYRLGHKQCAQRLGHHQRHRRRLLTEIIVRAQPRHLTQQRTNIGLVGAALLVRFEVFFRERGLGNARPDYNSSIQFISLRKCYATNCRARTLEG